jgi:hypothetical protein
MRTSSFVMVLQKPLKMTIGQLPLAYNQAVIPLNVAKGGFLRLRHLFLRFSYGQMALQKPLKNGDWVNVASL